MTTINLPLPYPLEIGSCENEGRRIARESGPLPRRTIEPSVHGKSCEHEKEETKAQHESASFATEPRSTHLMNARGVWNPKAKSAISQSWDWGGEGDEPR